MRNPSEVGARLHDVGKVGLEATYEESKLGRLVQLVYEVFHVWKLPMRNPSAVTRRSVASLRVVWKLPMRNPSKDWVVFAETYGQRLEATYGGIQA